jgi:RNA polymerase sigma-70 factor (ECF subfamily)
MTRECRSTWAVDGEFIERKIRFWVCDAVAKGGCLCEADEEDLAQSLRLDLLQRLRSFDPTKASLRTFITLVLEHRVRSLSEENRAAKRGGQFLHVSLDEPVDPEADDPLERHEVISQDDYFRGTRGPVPTCEASRDLALDLQPVEKLLTKREAELCRYLRKGSVTEAAAAMQIPRTTVQDMVRRIGGKLARAGIEKYFRVSPSSRERFR